MLLINFKMSRQCTKSVLLSLAIPFLATQVLAYKQEDLDKLQATNKCIRCDLSGADLGGANLSDANLHFANLQGTNLKGANLNWADLREADLRKADLNWARLKNADLRRADSVSYTHLTLPTKRIV